MYLYDFFRLVPKSRNIKIKSKKGIILNNPNGVKRYIFYVGNIVFIVGLIFLVYVYTPIGVAYVRYKNESLNKPTIPISVMENTEFRLEIPKILAESRVVSNVDPADTDTMNKILQNGNVALKTGSDMPGANGSMYIFAHSTEQNLFGMPKNAVFYLLNELNTDDLIVIHYHGETFKYHVFDKKIVGSGDIEYLDYKVDDQETVILQTCWPIGTNWKRLLIFAKRV